MSRLLHSTTTGTITGGTIIGGTTANENTKPRINTYQTSNNYNIIPHEAQHNINLDHLAENKHINELLTPMMPYPGSGTMLIVKGEYITTN